MGIEPKTPGQRAERERDVETERELARIRPMEFWDRPIYPGTAARDIPGRGAHCDGAPGAVQHRGGSCRGVRQVSLPSVSACRKHGLGKTRQHHHVWLLEAGLH